MTTEDLHKSIDAMEAGAELDKLVCEATDTDAALFITPRFSSDPWNIKEMLEWAKASGFYPSLFQGLGDVWTCAFRSGGDWAIWASGNTINLACARAIAKTAGRGSK